MHPPKISSSTGSTRSQSTEILFVAAPRCRAEDVVFHIETLHSSAHYFDIRASKFIEPEHPGKYMITTAREILENGWPGRHYVIAASDDSFVAAVALTMLRHPKRLRCLCSIFRTVYRRVLAKGSFRLVEYDGRGFQNTTVRLSLLRPKTYQSQSCLAVLMGDEDAAH